MVEEKEQGIGGEEVKRNYFWQPTTVTDDDDVDAARCGIHGDAPRRFVRRDAAI